jgi:hypothetical protein
MAQVVDVEDSVRAPRPVPAARLRTGFLALTSRYTGGLVRGTPWRFRLGPLDLITFGDPDESANAVRWPVTGGALTARPGGWVGFEWEGGELRGHLAGWAPRLPLPLYRVTQLLVHHAVTRLTLLQLRGRDPLPGEPAGQRSRVLAAGVDLALCVAVARAARRRRWKALAGVYAGYHVAAWALAGRTAGGALFGTRLLAVDGSRATLAQALVRLLAGDAAAGTAVVRDAGPLSPRPARRTRLRPIPPEVRPPAS